MQSFSKTYKYIIALFIVVSLLMLIPLIAMQYSHEVVWTLSDFVIAWILLFGTGLIFILISTRINNLFYKAAVGLAVVTALFLIWSNLAVGLIGSEDNQANLMYGAVFTVLFLGSIIARLQPKGMSITLLAAAFTQAIICIIAIIGGYGLPENSPMQLVFINGFFITLFLGSSLLFWFATKKSLVKS